MELSEDVEKKIIANNDIITKLLKENEQLLIDEGFNIPVDNIALDSLCRINFPSGYIRANEYFIRKYHLEELVSKKSTRKNIAYSFQLSDFYNYMINRFYIWGSVAIMFLKTATINNVSIMEALIFECAENICNNHSNCKTKDCLLRFNKQQRCNSYEALNKMQLLHITEFTDDEMRRIKEIIDLRNRVHIRLSPDNEFLSNDFSYDLYNETIMLIKKLDDYIYNNGLRYFNKCNFE